jgi:hypothetical protein
MKCRQVMKKWILAVLVAVGVYLLIAAFQAGNVGPDGPNFWSAFLSIIVSPGYHFIPPLAGVVAGMAVFLHLRRRMA